jgi:hypothetical protein
MTDHGLIVREIQREHMMGYASNSASQGSNRSLSQDIKSTYDYGKHRSNYNCSL